MFSLIAWKVEDNSRLTWVSFKEKKAYFFVSFVLMLPINVCFTEKRLMMLIAIGSSSNVLSRLSLKKD